MPKNRFSGFGKAMVILGCGVAAGYLKCLKDIKKKYGDVIEDDYITVEPNKAMSVGIRNAQTEES